MPVRQSLLFRLGFIVFVVANVSLVLYGALALMWPGMLLDPFLRHIYRFPAEATRATEYLKALFRLLGFFNGLLGAASLLLLHRWRFSQEKGLLRAIIVTTALAYLAPIVFDNTVGSIGGIEIVEHILFALMILLGIFLWRERNG